MTYFGDCLKMVSPLFLVVRYFFFNVFTCRVVFKMYTVELPILAKKSCLKGDLKLSKRGSSANNMSYSIHHTSQTKFEFSLLIGLNHLQDENRLGIFRRNLGVYQSEINNDKTHTPNMCMTMFIILLKVSLISIEVSQCVTC